MWFIDSVGVDSTELEKICLYHIEPFNVLDSFTVLVLYGTNCRSSKSLTSDSIALFNVDHKSGKELRQYLSNIADQCEHCAADLPSVIILDNLHHVASLSEVFNGFLSVKYHTRYAPSDCSDYSSHIIFLFLFLLGLQKFYSKIVLHYRV